MYQGSQEGRIEVISGVMFSGKSEELLRRVRRALIARHQVQLFKSHLDDRYAGASRISSHDGATLEAEPVRTARELRQRLFGETNVVAIDEVQFLDDEIVGVVRWLADRDVRVIVAGTDMDFRGEPFGPIPSLMAIADEVDKLHAICVRCGAPATRNQRLIDGRPAPAEGPVVQVGGSESYEARCRRCHELPRATRHQTELDIRTEADAWARRTRFW